MAAGIATAKAADLRAERDAFRAETAGFRTETGRLERETAAAHRRIAEQDREIARLAEAIGEAEAAQAAKAAALPAAVPLAHSAETGHPEAPAAAEKAHSVETPHPEAPAPDPAAEAWAREDTQLAGLAILARERPEGGSRQFWLWQVDLLGRHLLPDASQAEQRAAALWDERGRAFAEARQQCPT